MFRQLPGIYKITNTVNNKVYVGSSINVSTRITAHKHCLKARQKDAVKNSISILAQSLYSHSELHKKNGSDMQEMCFQKGHNWNDLHFSKKRGSFIIKNTYCDGVLEDTWYLNKSHGCYPVRDEPATIRTKWEVVETPEFSSNQDVINSII